MRGERDSPQKARNPGGEPGRRRLAQTQTAITSRPIVPHLDPHCKPQRSVSLLVDQTIRQQEKHEELACYHLTQAERARMIRRELERIIPELEHARVKARDLFFECYDSGLLDQAGRAAETYRGTLRLQRRARRLWEVYGG